MSKIKILGEDWTIRCEKELPERWGEADFTTRTIDLCVNLETQKGIKSPHDNVIALKNNVIRHEVIHAMFYEAGIDFGYSMHNEDNVEWIAKMFPKLIKIFTELGVTE